MFPKKDFDIFFKFALTFLFFKVMSSDFEGFFVWTSNVHNSISGVFCAQASPEDGILSVFFKAFQVGKFSFSWRILGEKVGKLFLLPFPGGNL